MKSQLLVSLACLALAGCGGVADSIASSFNPYDGSYAGNLTFAQGNTVEPIALNVSGTGHVTGTFTDPSLGEGTLSGNINNNGTVTGTTHFTSASGGTFTLTIASSSNGHYQGAGTFTQGGNTAAVAIDVTKT